MKRVALLSAALLLSVTASFGSGVLVEAESFRDKGGWAVDQQFMDQMGSPYLIAHGMGKPVADAVTTVEFPETGTYRVYVRTFNWVAPWYDGEGPGKGTAHPCIQRRADAVRRLVLPGARKEPLEDEAGHGISEVERNPREMDRRARAREEEGV